MLGLLLYTACAPSRAVAPPSLTSTGAPFVEPSSTLSPIPPTPAPTETLVPAPRVFTEEFDGALPYWSSVQIDNGQPASGPVLKSGFLVFDLSATNQWVYSFYGAQEYTDARVDARTSFLTGSDGAVGVACRYSETDGWYEFNIYPDQTFTLLFGQWLAEGLARYAVMYRNESEKIKSDANEIGLLCEGNTLTPFINGTQMRKWQDQKYGLKNGKIGLSASSFANAPLTIGFDWIKVSTPPGTP